MDELTAEQIGMDRISPSKLTTFEECPKLFYYRCWLGLEIEENKLHMNFGTAIHETIGQIYVMYDDNFGGAWDGKDFEELEKYWKQQWKLNSFSERDFELWLETRQGRDSGFTEKKQLWKLFYDDGIKMIQSYWDKKEVLLSEYGYNIPVMNLEIPAKTILVNPENPNDKLPIPLSMRLDAMTLIEDKVIDFKTSGAKYNAAESRKKIQGQCYLLEHLSRTGKLITKFDYLVLRKWLKTPDRIEVVELEYDRADLTALYFRIKSILQKIANKEFDAPMVGHPSYCQCRKYEEALSVKGIN